MSVDDHGIEAIRKSAEETPLGQKAEYRLKVRVTNAPSDPIPVAVVDADPGNPFHSFTADTTDPGNEKTVLTDVVAVAQRSLSRLQASCRVESVVYIKVDSQVIGTCRTGAGRPDSSIEFRPQFPVLNGEQINISIKARSGSPITDCEFLLMGTDTI